MNSARNQCFGFTSVPLVIVVSGPSGVGKDAILHRLKKNSLPLQFITTMTTRTRRQKEKDGVDYYFVSEETFQDLLRNHGLLEFANVYGNWYGVPKLPVKEAINAGKDAIIKVDIQGAFSIKKIVPQAILIFIAPPTLEELAERLRSRRTESEFDLTLRLKTAEEELQKVHFFDYRVVNYNNQIDQAVDQILAIITAEKCRTNPRQANL